MELNRGSWSKIEIMKMQLGFQILIHNIAMITCILVLAKVLGIFSDSVLLLTAYGLLKMSAGGIHFEKSLTCLISTGIFIVCGVFVSSFIKIKLSAVVLIYVICIVALWIIGPQGTDNNPISKRNYKKLRYETVIISCIYLLITICSSAKENEIPYVFLIAIVFETISLLPNKIKKRRHCL